MTAETRESIAALRRAHEELVAGVGGLGDDGLGTRSGSAEWTVADVLSHLGSAAEIGVATLASGQGDMGAATAVWDRWNAMSPAEQAAGYVTAGAQLVEAFEALDDDALAHRKLDLGFLPAPIDVGFFAAMRHSEVGLHERTPGESSTVETKTRLALPAEALLRLTGGRLAPAHTPATVAIEGDVSLDDLRLLFPGY